MSSGGGDGVSNFPANPWAGAPGGADGSGGGADGGGGDMAGPSVASAGQEACEALEFDARLRNVDAGELARVSEGDILAVVYQDEPARMVAVLRHLPGGGPAATPVGALLDRLQELLPCLALLEFEAQVKHLDGGNTRVHVRPAST